MHERAALQHYCLEAMGITRWGPRATLAKSAAYLLFIDHDEKEGNNALSVQKQQLIKRMLQALHWSNHATKMIFVDNKRVVLKEYIQSVTQKILLFDIQIEDPSMIQAIQIATLPSLQALLAEPEAKKRAWKAMQPLVEN